MVSSCTADELEAETNNSRIQIAATDILSPEGSNETVVRSEITR